MTRALRKKPRRDCTRTPGRRETVVRPRGRSTREAPARSSQAGGEHPAKLSSLCWRAFKTGRDRHLINALAKCTVTFVSPRTAVVRMNTSEATAHQRLERGDFMAGE